MMMLSVIVIMLNEVGVVASVRVRLCSKNRRGASCQGIPELGGSTGLQVGRNVGELLSAVAGGSVWRWTAFKVRDYIRSPIPSVTTQTAGPANSGLHLSTRASRLQPCVAART